MNTPEVQLAESGHSTTMAYLDSQADVHYQLELKEQALETEAHQVLSQIIEWANDMSKALNCSTIQLEPDDIPHLKNLLTDLQEVFLPF